MKKALYGLSGDPPTIGHLFVIEKSANLFDELTIGIANNPTKKYTFSLEQRLELAQECCKQFNNVKVVSIKNDFLVRYAKTHEIQWVVRGIRNSADLVYEQGMMEVNHDIAPEVQTLFLLCPAELGKISSSMVKGLVGTEGWEDIIKKYVPLPCLNALKGIK